LCACAGRLTRSPNSVNRDPPPPGTPGYIEITGPTAATKLQATLKGIGSETVLSLLMGFESAPGPLLPFDGASLRGFDKISWVAVDSSKPVGGAGRTLGEAVGKSPPCCLLRLVYAPHELQFARVLTACPQRHRRSPPTHPAPAPRHPQGRARPDGAQCLVAIASPSFSRDLCPRGSDGALPPQTPELLSQLAPALHDALRHALARAGLELPEPCFIQAHRWGSAFPVKSVAGTCLRAESARLAACGDFCAGGGVEGAVMSGRAAADVVRQLFES
jgi:hypothetical protein